MVPWEPSESKLIKQWAKTPEEEGCTWGKAWWLKTSYFLSLMSNNTTPAMHWDSTDLYAGFIHNQKHYPGGSGSQTIPAHIQEGSLPILFSKLPLPMPPISSVSAQIWKKCCTRIYNDLTRLQRDSSKWTSYWQTLSVVPPLWGQHAALTNSHGLYASSSHRMHCFCQASQLSTQGRWEFSVPNAELLISLGGLQTVHICTLMYRVRTMTYDPCRKHYSAPSHPHILCCLQS